MRQVRQRDGNVRWLIVARGDAKTQIEHFLTSVKELKRAASMGVWVLDEAQAARVRELLSA